MVLTLVTLLGLMMKQREAPTNLYLLMAFVSLVIKLFRLDAASICRISDIYLNLIMSLAEFNYKLPLLMLYKEQNSCRMFFKKVSTGFLSYQRPESHPN